MSIQTALIGCAESTNDRLFVTMLVVFTDMLPHFVICARRDISVTSSVAPTIHVLTSGLCVYI